LHVTGARACDGGCATGRAKRPERIEEPLPEELERVLYDPEIAIPQDVSVHRLIRKHLRANPDAPVTRYSYLNLWALIDTGAFDSEPDS
jgi:hypothetical protein